MRLLRTTLSLWALLLSFIFLFLPGCGSSSANKVVSIVLSPSPVSVAYGQQILLTATAYNDNNSVLSTDFTYTSSNTSAISISPSGEVCGGTWDASFVNCSAPKNQTPASATITVTAQSVTQTVQAYVHESVDSVLITSGPGVGSSSPICASSTQCTCTSLSALLPNSNQPLPQFVATAYSSSISCASPVSGNLCPIPAGDLTGGSTTGGVNPFQWSSSDTTIATVDTSGTATAGTVTPVAPGQANIFASVGELSSPTVPFVTCPVTSLSLTASGAANSGVGQLTISPSGTRSLAVTVTDQQGKSILQPVSTGSSSTYLPAALSWLSSNFYAATVAAQTTSANITSDGVTTGVTEPLPAATATGVTSSTAALVASCTPPTCNKNLFPVYSNPIVTTNTGGPSPTVFVASSQSTTLLPISATSGALVSSALTLPSVPNSFMFNRQGTKAVLGSQNGVIIFDPSAVTFTVVQFNGKVLAISPDGSLAAVYGQSPGSTQNSIGIISLSGSTVAATFSIPGKSTDAAPPAVAADFSIDSRYLWVAVTPSAANSSAGNRIYVYTNGGAGAPFFNIDNPAKDVAFLASGPFVYLAGDTATASVTARLTCRTSQQAASSVTSGPDLTNGVVDVEAGTAPTNVRALPNGSGALALDLPNIDVIALSAPTSPFVGCPSTLSASIESMAPQNIGVTGSPTIDQFLVSQDSSTALLTTASGTVYSMSLSSLPSLTATPITLQNSALLQDPTTGLVFTGDLVGNSTFVVGGNDGYIHIISLTSNTDTAINLSSDGLLITNGTSATNGTPALPNLVAVLQ